LIVLCIIALFKNLGENTNQKWGERFNLFRYRSEIGMKIFRWKSGWKYYI